MKENKSGELQCLSKQQPTGHWIVVESPTQSLAKKNKKSKKIQGCPENGQKQTIDPAVLS